MKNGSTKLTLDDMRNEAITATVRLSLAKSTQETERRLDEARYWLDLLYLNRNMDILGNEIKEMEASE